MSVTFAPDGNRRYLRECGAVADDLDAFEVNICNAGAALMLDALGLVRAPKGGVDVEAVFHGGLVGEVDARDLLRRLDSAPSPYLLTRPGYVDRGGRSATVVFFGFDEDRVSCWYAGLRDVAQEAARRGVPVVWS